MDECDAFLKKESRRALKCFIFWMIILIVVSIGSIVGMTMIFDALSKAF